MLRRVLLLAAVTTGCASAPARRAPALCPESQSVCLTDRRCDYDARRDCTVCACVGAYDPAPVKPGPSSRAVPDGTPSRVPPPPPGK